MSQYRADTYLNVVAPLAGAWIEIVTAVCMCIIRLVAPLAGAWIEICSSEACPNHGAVAPLAGAWIEIITTRQTLQTSGCRSPRGSVD